MKLKSNHGKESCFATAVALVGGSILALHFNSSVVWPPAWKEREREKKRGGGGHISTKRKLQLWWKFCFCNSAADWLTWEGWGTAFVLICDPLSFMNGLHVARAQIRAAGEERTVTVLHLTSAVTFVSFKIQAWFKLHCIQQKPWCTSHQHKRPPLF